ncbi:MAG: hypothetical protein IT426_10105 [Pirellulales bacterium]|nr:hypothetical protein [Pirellulales bacterium]
MNREAVYSCASPKAVRLLWASALLGGLALALGGVLQPQRLWPNLLLLGFLAVGFGLGGLLQIAFRDLTGARWSDGFRCVREALGATLPWTAPILAAILIAGVASYPWYRPGMLAEETDWFKRGWLEPEFFTVRAISYLAIWMIFALAMVRASRREAAPGGPTRAGVRLSAAFLVVFSLTFWLAGTDWIMSLEPHWCSTAFAVYNFGGILSSSLAAITLAAVWLQRGPLKNAVTREHLRDLGTLLLGFSCFWMYIWFCQYMLIWYTNVPEEAAYYASRTHGLWAPLFYANVAINWAIPFAVLLPRASKESGGILVKVSLLVLAGRWLDVYLMILPSTNGDAPAIGFCELGAFALGVGAGGLLFLQALRKSRQLSTRELSCHAGDAPVCAEAPR